MAKGLPCETGNYYLELTGSYKALIEWDSPPHLLSDLISCHSSPFSPFHRASLKSLRFASMLPPQAFCTRHAFAWPTASQTAHMAHFLIFLSHDSNVTIPARPSLGSLSKTTVPQPIPFPLCYILYPPFGMGPSPPPPTRSLFTLFNAQSG